MTKKSIQHASADVGLIFTSFNLRRIFNLIDPNTLKKYLQVLDHFLWLVLKRFKPISTFFFRTIYSMKVKVNNFLMRLNQLYLAPINADLKTVLGF